MRARRRRLPVLAAVAAAALGPGAATVAASSSNIFTLAGSGANGFGGDGGAATSAALNGPRGVAWMPDGGFVFADFKNGRVRRVLPDGRVATVAGTGVNGYGGDGGPATSAQLNFVHGVAAMPDGGFLIDDEVNDRIRRVVPDGTIRTVAGTGVKGYRGDAGRATQARISDPRGIAATGHGGFLIADSDNHRVRCVTPGGTITTVAGDGTPGFRGDGGSAASSSLNKPFGVAPTADGGFLIADIENNRVRRVSPNGSIRTVAGNGAAPDAAAGDGGPAPGDGGPATAAPLKPWAVAATPDGGFLLADNVTDRVRYVSSRGTISTAAGNGLKGSAGDGGLASAAQLYGPRGLAVRADGNYLIAEFGDDNPPTAGGDRVRFVGSGPFAAVPKAPPSFYSGCEYRKLALRLLKKRFRVRPRRAFRVPYRVSGPATVVIDIFHGRKRIGRVKRGARAGKQRVTINRRLRPGRYVLRFRARSRGGRVARARASVTVSGR